MFTIKPFPLRKKLVTIVAILFLWMKPAVSQLLRQPVTAIYLNLNAYSINDNDVFSFLNNQASLAQTKSAAAGVYGEKRFLLAATSSYAAAIAIPSQTGTFGFQVKYAGFKNFNESEVGFAYARSLGSKVDIGIQFNYYSYRVPSYINVHTINFEIGAMIHLTDQLNAGIHVYNPVGGKFSKTGEQLSPAYNIGLGYDASDKFFIGIEAVKEEDYPVNVQAGMQYNFVKQFFARAGISSATSSAYGGMGISWNNLRLDIGGSYHPQLGWSPGFLLIMHFGEGKQSPEQIKPAPDNL
ncbi:MAG: hypothetical protein JWP81_1460 [Ferruginibacter sp.]|nr:hypothetical protein [Ferruginibacter sp.]